MKIIYSDINLKTELENILEKSEVDLEYKEPFDKKAFKKFAKKHPNIGCCMPELIDYEKHAINFIFSNPITTSMIGTIILDILKQCYRILKNKKSKEEKYKLAIITDENRTICFIIKDIFDEDDLEKAINTIPEARKRLLDLLEIVDISRTLDIIELVYTSSRWELRINN